MKKWILLEEGKKTDDVGMRNFDNLYWSLAAAAESPPDHRMTNRRGAGCHPSPGRYKIRFLLRCRTSLLGQRGAQHGGFSNHGGNDSKFLSVFRENDFQEIVFFDLILDMAHNPWFQPFLHPVPNSSLPITIWNVSALRSYSK